MRTLSRLSAAAVAVTFLAAFGSAQVADRPPATLKLLDGSSIRGNATSYDSDTGKLFFTTTDGQKLVLTKNELDVRSAYLLNRSNIPQDDAVLQLQLANFARDADLFAHSARHYKYAERADPSMKTEVEAQVAIMHHKAAVYCLEHLEAAKAAGDKSEATKWAKVLLSKLPDEPEAKIAEQMMDGLYAESHDARDDQLEASASELLATDFKSGKRHYDAMLKNNKKGLTTKSTSASRRAYEQAVKEGQSALKELDKIAKKRTDAASQEALAGYRTLLVSQIIDTHINLSSQYLTQSSYQNALREVNKALALDPKSEAALSMRSRVETASSQGIGGWWR